MVIASSPMAAIRTTSLPEEIRSDFKIFCIRNETTMEEEVVSMMKKAVRRNKPLQDIGRVGSTQLNIRRVPRELKLKFKALCRESDVPMERALVKLISDRLGWRFE